MMTITQAAEVLVSRNPGVMQKYALNYPSIFNQGKVAVVLHFAGQLGNRSQSQATAAVIRAAQRVLAAEAANLRTGRTWL